eukprot:6189071-Pleurochrysis_carterae.AAC.1
MEVNKVIYFLLDVFPNVQFNQITGMPYLRVSPSYQPEPNVVALEEMLSLGGFHHAGGGQVVEADGSQSIKYCFAACL